MKFNKKHRVNIHLKNIDKIDKANEYLKNKSYNTFYIISYLFLFIINKIYPIINQMDFCSYTYSIIIFISFIIFLFASYSGYFGKFEIEILNKLGEFDNNDKKSIKQYILAIDEIYDEEYKNNKYLTKINKIQIISSFFLIMISVIYYSYLYQGV